MAKKENKDIPLEIVEVFRSGPKVPRMKVKVLGESTIGSLT